MLTGAGRGVFDSSSPQMAALVAAKNWADTPIGDPTFWPAALRTILDVSLANRFPVVFWWGPQYVQFYNDPYAIILGAKHPAALGQSGWDCWAEIWDVVGPQIDSVYAGGPSTWNEDLFLIMNRHGFQEETYFTFSYSALPDPAAERGIGGVIGTVQETTEKVIAERRMRLLHDLAARGTEAQSVEQECRLAAQTLMKYGTTVPFALIYLFDAGKKTLALAASSGVRPESGAPETIDVGDESSLWAAHLHVNEGPRSIAGLEALFNHVPTGPWPEAPRTAVVTPIPSSSAGEPAGVLFASASPRLPFDDSYRDFFALVAAQIGTAISAARAYEEERRRAEALAEIDRAKNVFFSNVSHEFRTPLTLMLGPLSDLARDAREEEKPLLEAAHRNALRLLKLVNTLLEFSRLEAGRADATYTETDLAALTEELCSVFRSAIESAGLTFEVEIDLRDRVFVDRSMWEKIVLNLLSNALKFTLEGGIRVTLHEAGGAAELCVHDTGSGIAAAELPHLFERFRRVRGAKSRTHEGSGIGLALVKDLVELHAGSVTAASEPGVGTAFTVRIPLGHAHLENSRVMFEVEGLAHASDVVHQYLAEVDSTITRSKSAAPPEAVRPQTGRPRILIADDNADLRDYLTHILSDDYDVTAVRNGREALASMAEAQPALVISDVMMPEMDGLELLKTVREDSRFGTTAFILLSARAGEEAAAEGLMHGADDYLAKPFSRDDLLMRVRANLASASIREQALQNSEQWFRTIADRLPFVVFQRDATGQLIFTNSAWHRWLGLSREVSSFKMAAWRSVIHPDDFERTMAVAAEAISKRTPYRFEYRVKHVSAPEDPASYRWYISSAEPQYADDVFVGWTGYVIDVHDARQRENIEREFHALAEAIPVIAFSADAKGAIEWYNNRWYEYTGQTREQAIGWGWQSVHHPEDLPRVMQAWLESVRTGRPFEMEFRLRRHDGAYRQFLTRIRPLRDASGKILHWYGSNVDIHAQKEALERSKRVAETLQAVFLPDKLPHTERVRFDALYLAAEKDALVGGDWYDAVQLPDKRILVSIGDVTGHGLDASVIAGALRQSIMAFALAQDDAATILENANRMLFFQYPEKFATALVGIVDRECTTFSYACAGHPPPMLASSKDEDAQTLPGGGLPLGVQDGVKMTSRSISLPKDSVLLLYTDGLTEYARDIETAEAKLRKAIAQLVGDVAASSPARKVQHAVMGSASARDDLAVLVAQFSAVDAAHVESNPAALIKEWRFHSSDAYTARSSRHDVMKFIDQYAIDREALFAVELILGEILANTVQHAPGLVEMKIDWRGARPLVTVRDTGPGMREFLGELPQDAYREKGRGLFLIQALAREVEIGSAPGFGTELRVELPIRRALHDVSMPG